MKHLFIILFISICFFQNALGNKIDSLKTDDNVANFIASLFQETFKRNYYKFSLSKPDSVSRFIPCDSIILNWETKSWQKIDFNNDGLTDLFAIVYQQDTINSKVPDYKIYIVIDKGYDKFQLQEIPDYFEVNCYAAKPIFINNIPYLQYRYYRTDFTVDSLPKDSIPTIDNYHYFEVGKTDTLVYKFGAFIELNTTKFSPSVKSIFFETSGCLGSCPVFKLNIFNDGKAYFTSEFWNAKDGNFQTTIKPKELTEILDLIKYLNIPNLYNSYSAEGTDRPGCNTTIFFSDGSVKKIYDYGQQGTLGLVRLYRLLFLLRENQNWK